MTVLNSERQMRLALKGAPKVARADMETEADIAFEKKLHASYTIRRYRETLKYAFERNEEWAADILKNPGYIFSYDSQFLNSAKIWVMQSILANDVAAQDNDPIAWVAKTRANATEEALRRAKYGHNSTSRTSNLYEYSLDMVWADVASGTYF